MCVHVRVCVWCLKHAETTLSHEGTLRDHAVTLKQRSRSSKDFHPVSYYISYLPLNFKKKTVKIWYTWITFILGCIHTQFHLDCVSNFRDMGIVNLCFCASPVTLSKGHRSPKQCTLVVLIKVYNSTKFEEIRYHSTRITAKVKSLDEF